MAAMGRHGVPIGRRRAAIGDGVIRRWGEEVGHTTTRKYVSIGENNRNICIYQKHLLTLQAKC